RRAGAVACRAYRGHRPRRHRGRRLGDAQRASHEGEALTLSGPEPLTPGEQVAALGHALRRPLRYDPPSDDEARASMAADGTPASLIDAFFRFFSAGEFDDSAITATVHEITGRPPHTFDHWAHAHTDLFR